MADGYQLVMREGPRPGQTFPLDQESLTLGRDPRNDIVIDHPQVSRKHARITRQGELMMLEDRGSTNGTFVDGTRLTGPHTLVDGDVIGLSEAVALAYRETGAAAMTTGVDRPAAVPPSAPRSRGEAPPRPSRRPSYRAPSGRAVPRGQDRRDEVWLWLGIGCLVLSFTAACAAAVVLDYLELLPAFFYELLRWLGLI